VRVHDDDFGGVELDDPVIPAQARNTLGVAVTLARH
tara:strand:+ start:14195 stop:14302 length:108 start_codon:yes stop_codon:yes gene_type:complete